MTFRRSFPPSVSTHASRAQRGGTLLGIFIGLVIGLSIAMGVAYYVTKAGNPYQTANPKEGARTGRSDGSNSPGAGDKPRFDFYKILPGVEEPRLGVQPRHTDKNASAGTEPADAGKPGPVLRLQAGAFNNEAEAENLKARLALAGLEAEIVVANVPDKGVVYRVRLGPYDNADEMNKIKNELGKRGFEASVIKG